MRSLRNQAFNQAQKDRADEKLLMWLPFGAPGTNTGINVSQLALQSGIGESRTRRSLKRLVDRGLVIRERRRKGANDEHVSDLTHGWEHLYYRPAATAAPRRPQLRGGVQ